MRSNLPVTDNEYILHDSETIVSNTNLKGKITYVNHDFIRISQFSEEELLNAPHNIVRHPDMPAEAFDDLWRTLKKGKAWTGLVKNRCKNGDFYWVEANVAPLLENNQVIGYTSIRGKPSRENIQAASDAYRAVKAGDKRLAIREGKAVMRSPFDFLAVFKDFSTNAELVATFGMLFALFALTAVLAWWPSAGGAGANRANLAGWASAVAALGALLSVLFGFMLHKGISEPLRRALKDIRRMSSGDLTGKIASSGENEISKVMQALKVLQINVKLLIGQITQASGTVNTGAGEIAAGIFDLSGRTESQASSLEETASAMEQLTSTIKQTADNALEASDLVMSTSIIAVKGGEAVAHVVDTMDSIKESSRKIVDIISVIDGIAFQTNILALNAAVEAARAGEQGRGFAVVASEVRALAQRSASAAKEIKTLINSSVEKVEGGSKLVDDAGKTMGEIVSAVKRAADIMADISASSREQSQGVEQVNIAISQMDEITQKNATLVEQAATAASTVKKQADDLSELVAAFKLMSGDHAPHARSVAKASLEFSEI